MNIEITLRDLSRLAARLTLGGTMAAHGAQKMFGVQGGPGLEGTTGMMRSLGFEPADRYARAVAATEMTSGGLIALGALGPVGPAMLLSVMLVAVETVHRPKGYWNTNGGFEMNTMFALLALMLANEGYGTFSIDHLLGLSEKMRPSFGWLAMAGAIGAAFSILGRRTQQKPQAEQTQPSQHANARDGEPAMR